MYSQEKQKSLLLSSRGFLTSKESSFSSEHIEILRNVIRYHEWRYYVKNDPLVSDSEYDELFHLLRQVEKTSPSLITIDSPTQRVSSDLSAGFPSVRHFSPMLSLGNAYNEEDLKDFDLRIKKQLAPEQATGIQYVAEPKFDGGTVVLVYENDYLIRASTRGNGINGDEITANIRAIKSIPLKASFSKYGWSRVEIRGEAVIGENAFSELNKKKAELGEPLFANPRNAATGGLRMKDPRQVEARKITFFCFQISYVDGGEFPNSHYESIELLDSMGFLTPGDAMQKFESIEKAAEYCISWQDKRNGYPFDIDGMVVKLDDTALQEICGVTSHHPRWAIAYKFKAKQATTQLLSVEYQVGKIGNITPVAKVEPVHLAGVTVSSISLHNADFIESRDLHYHDTILIERAGDVIPYLVKAFPELRKLDAKPVLFPRICPFDPDCEAPLVREKNEVAWRCVNCNCGHQTLQKMIFHVSKSAMDIDGLGKSMVERFHNLEIITDLADIYNIDYDLVSQLEGLGEKSVINLKKSINKAKSNPIHKLLHSLSIHHLGKRTSSILAEQIKHVLDLKEWEVEDYTKIKDIGPVVANNIYDYFHTPKNITLLETMEANGVNLNQTDEDRPIETASEGPFVNKSILFTGTLSQFTRKEAQQLARKKGARPLSGFSAKLDILVTGEKAGSKLKKAQEIGSITILTESEFADLIEEN